MGKPRNLSNPHAMATDTSSSDDVSPPEEKPSSEPTTITTTADPNANHESLKYSLLGPSLTKAGQDSVDQSKVSEIIYSASKGSKFFSREEEKDKILTAKIAHILAKKARLSETDLTRDLRAADARLAELELSRDLSQHIVHIDCDAFYAAVEQLDRPDLADVPFAVGGGVLTTCNYAARRYGCRSGMAGFVAKKLCPQLVLLPLRFDKYNAKAAEVREVLARYDPRFESASIDEAYLNITAYCEETGLAPAEAVEGMRREIHDKTGITVSAGIAANARLAKICSNINKPDGQFELPNERAAVLEFMRDLPCRKVNGIGRVFERELAAVGVRTCGDVHGQRRYLARLFGDKAAEFLLACHLGLGRTSVQPAEEYERKSVGTESTFRDLADPAQLRAKLRWTADELEKDMRRAGCKGRTLVLKVKLHTYEVFTRQVVTPKAVWLADDLYGYALPILARLEQEMPGMKLRLMGLRCTHLVSTKKPDTLAFFGLKPRRAESAGSSAEDQGGGADGKVAQDDGEWEQWPEEELDGYEIEVDKAPASPERREQGSSPLRRHGKEKIPNPNPTPEKAPAAAVEEWWDCPICSRPQTADERLFNEHIDLCLSRQAIRETVQQDAALSSAGPAPESKRPGSIAEKKRGRPAHGRGPDPRQKKLCFG